MLADLKHKSPFVQAVSSDGFTSMTVVSLVSLSKVIRCLGVSNVFSPVLLVIADMLPSQRVAEV